MTLTQHKI